jgi:outer membrane receptor protein involved in Fe transport
VTARGYEEYRDNGTPYQRNGSREKFASFALAGQPSDTFAWNAVAYGQDQSFASTFSSVNAARTAETPASDQFAVPATAAGAAWTGVWKNARAARTSFGADARFVRGETRENFTFTNGVFTRQRVAGGEQQFGGLFALHERPLSSTLRATLGGRLDAWSDSEGHRRETDRFTGAVLRDDHLADHDSTEFSPSAGLVWQPAKAWRLRAAAQQAFRRPTLNELYRPFRQGSNVTEANPDLKNERVTSGELGVEWKGRAFAFTTAGFWNDLHNAVGNVTLARGPGTFPLFGTLAAGGVGRQRLNLDRIRVQGVELSATWAANPSISVNAAYQYDDATVRRASIAPALVGKRLAQVPRHNATLGGTWRAPGGVVVTPRVRWIGRQFEDDENALILGEAVVADVTLSRLLGKHLELFLTVENLGGARVETGRSADGVVNVGTPRLAIGGLRGAW